MGKLVQIATYPHPWQAHAAQGLLEAQGIKAFVFDDGAVQANPFLSLVIGGVRVMVDKSDVEPALALLSSQPMGDQAASHSSQEQPMPRFSFAGDTKALHATKRVKVPWTQDKSH